MKELDFEHGRLSFSGECFEMIPCLPDFVEMRTHLFFVGPAGFTRGGFIDFDRLAELRKDKRCVWLHLSGSFTSDFWEALGDFADLSDEQVKYLRSPHKRSFIEESHNAVFWSVFCPAAGEAVSALEVVNFLLSDGLLITRQFSQDDIFTYSAHKLMSDGEHCTIDSADALSAYLVENILFRYFDVLSVGGTRLETLQSRIIRNPGKEELELINRAQQLIWIYLKTVWPVESVTQTLVLSRSRLISEVGRTEFLRCREVAESVLRLFETYRDMSYDVMDVYVSGLGLKTNETTKILTVIATLFLPPTLIAGIYGMNFQIPEVTLPYGYQIALAAMFLVSGGLLFWLHRNDYIDFP